MPKVQILHYSDRLLGGAWAAQRIAERAKSKDEILKEIRATNASIILAFWICNTLILAKRQVVQPMKTRFEQDLARIDEVIKKTLSKLARL